MHKAKKAIIRKARQNKAARRAFEAGTVQADRVDYYKAKKGKRHAYPA